MTILHSSIFKELSLTFLLSLVSLNFVLMTEKLLRLSRVLSGVGSSIADVIVLIAYIQPPLLLLTIPMAFLLSTLLVYGRMNIDNELIVMKMSGMHFFGLTVPAAVLGILCFFASIAVSFYLGPKSTTKLREETAYIVKKRAPLALEEGKFNPLFRDIVMYVKEKPSDTKVRNVFLYDSRSRGEPKVLLATEGEITVDDNLLFTVLLKDGYIHMVKGNNVTEIFFRTYALTLQHEAVSRVRKAVEMTPSELIEEIRHPGGRKVVSLYLELYRRISLPFMCIVLVFFGPPVALLAGKAGRLGGLTIGLVVFTAYYLLLIYSENLVKAAKIPHEAGAWIATAVLSLAAVIMFVRECRR